MLFLADQTKSFRDFLNSSLSIETTHLTGSIFKIFKNLTTLYTLYIHSIYTLSLYIYHSVYIYTLYILYIHKYAFTKTFPKGNQDITIRWKESKSWIGHKQPSIYLCILYSSQVINGYDTLAYHEVFIVIYQIFIFS